MRYRMIVAASLFCSLGALAASVAIAHADGDLHKVNHIIIVMQENHSFDNYFGVLPYVAGGPYHRCRKQNNGVGNPHGNPANDHQCVDGLDCHRDGPQGPLVCINKNRDEEKGFFKSFHEQTYCNGPDLDHGWVGTHFEGNFMDPKRDADVDAQ